MRRVFSVYSSSSFSPAGLAARCAALLPAHVAGVAQGPRAFATTAVCFAPKKKAAAKGVHVVTAAGDASTPLAAAPVPAAKKGRKAATAAASAPEQQSVATYTGPPKMTQTRAYKEVLQHLPTPRTFAERERRIIVNDLKDMSLLEYHKGIAGALITAGSLQGAQHLPPTSILMGWWQCSRCDHKHRSRVFNHVIGNDGECPQCHHKPTADDTYEATGKVLMRAGKENVFASRKTGATQQDIPFLANSSRRYSPMLAAGWEDHKRTYTGDTIMVSNKLDGIRCIAAFDPSTKTIHFFTRTGTMLESCDHLEKALAPLFAADNGLVLDGELYAHNTFKDFQEVFSAVRTTRERRTPEVLAIQQRLQYHIFDAMYSTSAVSGLPEDAGYAARVAYLKKMVPALEGEKGKLLVVDGTPMQFADADRALDEALAAGYEGIMIRHPNGRYEHGKRSVSLLKHKKMYDQEYEIVHCVEGKGKFAGRMGSLICKGPNGKTFAANPAVSEAMRKEMWERRAEYIGQVGTVQYQELTRDGIPRFPVLKCVRGAKNGSNWL